MTQILNQCRDFINCIPPSIQQLALATRFHWDKITAKCLKWACNQSLHTLKRDRNYEEIETDVKVKLLEKKLEIYETLLLDPNVHWYATKASRATCPGSGKKKAGTLNIYDTPIHKVGKCVGLGQSCIFCELYRILKQADECTN